MTGAATGVRAPRGRIGGRHERPRPPRSTSVGGAVAQFVIAGLVSLLVLAGAVYVGGRRAADLEAIHDAEMTTESLAHNVIEPKLDEELAGLETGDAAARAEMDKVYEQHLKSDDLVRVKIWNTRGELVWSDEKRLYDSSPRLDRKELAAFSSTEPESEISRLNRRENVFEEDYGKLLEVYLPIKAQSGDKLLFETYTRYSAVEERGRQIVRTFTPIMIGALLLLELVQVPLAWSMARRLRQGQREREQLLRRAVEASDAERRRIASDLHDGIVQDLAGASYSLTAAADTLAHGGAKVDASGTLRSAAGSVRHSIRALRSLLVEIYPPNLHTAGLEPALSDLLAPLATRDIETSLTVPDTLDAAPGTEALVFRVAQEALRNVVSHAHASRVDARLEARDGTLVFTVEDDGVGFDPETLGDRPARGHFGLRLLGDLVDDAGGRLHVESARGSGTLLRLEVPRW